MASIVPLRLSSAFLVAFVLGCGSGSASSERTPPPDAGAPATWTMRPIGAPVSDDCITKVNAGDHTFTCSGLTFLVMVDDLCTKYACGLIFDIHGAPITTTCWRAPARSQEPSTRRRA